MTLGWRLFLGIVVLFAGGLYVFINVIDDDLQPRYREATEEPIVDTSRVLASIAAATASDGQIDLGLFGRAFDRLNDQPFRAQIYDFLKTEVDLRVYLTDADGNVIFDSDEGHDVGEDYSQWRDVYLTLHGEYGARTSPARKHPDTKILYVASPVVVDDTIIGVLSVGKSAANSNRFIDAARRDLTAGALILFGVLVVCGLALGYWLSQPIRRLTRYALSVRDGQRVVLPALPRGELAELGTAFEEMRQTLEGRQYVGNYVQTLTHEIKSPVAAIRGAAELLTEELPEEKRRDFVDNIVVEAERINRLSETLLLLTSVESRDEIHVREDVELADVVDAVVEAAMGGARQRDVKLLVNALAKPRVIGDEVLIHQAISNLVQNALAFAPPGSDVSLSVDEQNDAAIVAVIDNGPGVPNYARARVFDRFYSLPRPDSGKKSSGLGLPLVKEIMSLHGGEIDLRDAENGGTQATLRFPRAH